MYGSDDCAVRERDCPLLKGLDRYFVAELSTQLVELVGLELVHRDQLPIAVSGRNRDAVDRGGIALRRGPCDIQSTKRENSANAQSKRVFQSATSGMKHDSLLEGGRRKR